MRLGEGMKEPKVTIESIRLMKLDGEKEVESKKIYTNPREKGPSILDNYDIILDTREGERFQAKFVKYFLERGVLVAREKLPIGDIIVGNYLIERKGVVDFCLSWLQNRLHKQLNRLMTIESHTPILVIHGYWKNAVNKLMPILKGSRSYRYLEEDQVQLLVLSMLRSITLTIPIKIFCVNDSISVVRLVEDLGRLSLGCETVSTKMLEGLRRLLVQDEYGADWKVNDDETRLLMLNDLELEIFDLKAKKMCFELGTLRDELDELYDSRKHLSHMTQTTNTVLQIVELEQGLAELYKEARSNERSISTRLDDLDMGSNELDGSTKGKIEELETYLYALKKKMGE